MQAPRAAGVFFVTGALFLLLLPETAWAWGPATHLWIGQNVLSALPRISADAAAYLSAYPLDYLYGCIGADIIFGKNLAEYRYHCHNWNVAYDLLHRCRTDHHRAFVHGYFTHLAADIVSHNIFVPFQLINFFYKRRYKHTYWEYCIERHVLPDLHVSFRDIFKQAATRNNDLLEANLTPTLLTFKVNRFFFSSVMLLDRFRRRSLSQNVYIPAPEIEAYLGLALENALQFLKEGRRSPQFKADPAGLKNIAEARQLRVVLRRSLRRKRAHKRAWKRKGIHLSATHLPSFAPYPLEKIIEGKIPLLD